METLYGVSGVKDWDGTSPLLYCGPSLTEALNVKKKDRHARTIYILTIKEVKKVDVCVSCGQTIKEEKL
jgi:hypothetical protein